MSVLPDQLSLESTPLEVNITPVFTIGSGMSFNIGTMIRCTHGCVAIQELKIDDLVTTYIHGDRKIKRIILGTSTETQFIKTPHTMCMMKNEIQDLYVTGGLPLMVNDLTADEEEKQTAIGFSESVDGKRLLLAMVSSRFEVAPNGIYQTYHFVLENDGDADMRYGVWANGILCATPSENQSN